MAFIAQRTSLLTQGQKQHFRKLFVEQATGSFLTLSLGTGLVAALLPLVLRYEGGSDGVYSISYYYWVQNGGMPRNWLVGSLWATGIFLFLFRGLSRKENWALNVAGFFAIMIAMNPMANDQSCSSEKIKGVTDLLHSLSIHGTCAMIFFICLAVVAIFFSKDRVNLIPDPQRRRWFKFGYNLAGTLMVALPTVVLLIHKLSQQDCRHPTIFWCETFGIEAFAAYWFLKTYEYRLLLGARIWRKPGSEAVVTIEECD